MAGSEESFVVEAVLAHKKSKTGVKYLIKWDGYELEEATWEPEENFNESHKKIFEKYFANPRPNATRIQLIRERDSLGGKALRSKSFEEESIEALDKKVPGEKMRRRSRRTEAELNASERSLQKPMRGGKIDTTVEKKPAEEKFDLRSFLKLGFMVSAIIVLLFIIFSTQDAHYIQKYMKHFEGVQAPLHRND